MLHFLSSCWKKKETPPIENKMKSYNLIFKLAYSTRKRQKPGGLKLLAPLSVFWQPWVSARERSSHRSWQQCFTGCLDFCLGDLFSWHQEEETCENSQEKRRGFNFLPSGKPSKNPNTWSINMSCLKIFARQPVVSCPHQKTTTMSNKGRVEKQIDIKNTESPKQKRRLREERIPCAWSRMINKDGLHM